MKDSIKLMGICVSELPDTTEEYIPDLVHDFIWDNWEKLKELLNDD